MKLIALSGKRGAGKFAKVDDSKFASLSKYHWYFNDSGYAVRMVDTGKGHSRTSIRMQHDVLPKRKGMDTDHKDGDRLNNCTENLRYATRSQNNQNGKGWKRAGSPSIYKGVCWHKRARKWTAAIKLNGRKRYLGLFENERHAAMAYDIWARDLFGAFARTNLGACIIN
jgi:hypothetical protein